MKLTKKQLKSIVQEAYKEVQAENKIDNDVRRLAFIGEVCVRIGMSMQDKHALMEFVSKNTIEKTLTELSNSKGQLDEKAKVDVKKAKEVAKDIWNWIRGKGKQIKDSPITKKTWDTTKKVSKQTYDKVLKPIGTATTRVAGQAAKGLGIGAGVSGVALYGAKQLWDYLSQDKDGDGIPDGLETIGAPVVAGLLGGAGALAIKTGGDKEEMKKRAKQNAKDSAKKELHMEKKNL